MHASLVLAKYNFKVAVHIKKQIQILYSIAILEKRKTVRI